MSHFQQCFLTFCVLAIMVGVAISINIIRMFGFDDPAIKKRKKYLGIVMYTCYTSIVGSYLLFDYGTPIFLQFIAIGGIAILVTKIVHLLTKDFNDG